MSTWLFVGPTLAPAGAPAAGGVVVRPPVAAGDIYAAVLDGASRLAIVDGFWGDRPTVRHKEILWAMRQGVPVLGAASMGALRAAELAPFGMIGVGEIFRRYATGALTRDGDVAIAHAPAALGWLPLSIAVVDVEARLGRAIAAADGPVDDGRLATWIEAARAIPLRDRTEAAVVDRWRRLDAAHRPPASLMAAVADDAFSRKRADAERLVAELAAPSPRPATPAVPEDGFHARALEEAERARRASGGKAGGA